MPMMEIAFEKLDECLKRSLVYLSVFPQSFKRDAAEAILGDNCAEALTNLKKRCLIQKQGDRYLIHLLIRSYAKQTLFNEERANLESTLREVACGQTKVENGKELKDVVDACGQVAPYIEDCVPFKLYDDFLNGLLQFSRIQGSTTKQVEILCLLYDESRRHGGDMEKSKELIDQAIKLHNSNLPAFEQNSMSEAFYLSHYGRYLSQELQQRVQAQPLLQKVISIVENEVVQHASTFDMGRVLCQMGHNARLGEKRDQKAEAYFQRALHFRQSRFGVHVLTALAHKDVAGFYVSTKDFGEAEKNYEAAVQIFEDMGMMKQKEAVPTFKNFGRCYVWCRKYDQDRRKFEMGSEVAENTIVEITSGKLRSTLIWH